jgi:protein O-GlcNAc transferase
MFMIPVLERHGRIDFTIYCYFTGAKKDEITQRIISFPDHWIDAADLSEQQLADRIYQDKIDILVDLGGLTANSRLRVYAQQPAPVQVSWMGYLNTTGLTRMHYRLCDERTDPPGIADALHTEKLVRLPYSQWCYRPFITVEAATAQAPWENNGFITFGSYNHVLKISPRVCTIWAEILKQVPNSRLLCVGLSSSRKMAELLSELTLTGVNSERIQFIARTSLDQYYDWFSAADIALDTFPYGGGTTTFDALWMGVPVVAAKGSTPTSRSAASILEALGLDDWVAPSIDEYVQVAVERANDKEQLSELRRTLRPRLQASPLMDEERFVRDLEAAYRQMWREWCATASPVAPAD